MIFQPLAEGPPESQRLGLSDTDIEAAIDYMIGEAQLTEVSAGM